eukprot:CAMPEP_0174744506 /NCGR_PEP_ID=MMETSP1094-20130205/84533_1 /TAXON_ID=156173 /ORGANISM="Chrysochromulina brevifilum, Strain UTEX LB 985" /LENGTH=80 /DNA_ID=CAMNT_0015948909 /DNA_START=1 /DNA_END=243 /DNA_ORIENTATION=-
MKLQERSLKDYSRDLLWAYGLAIGQSVVINEPIKLICITLISPQMLPSVLTIRETAWRESCRLAARGLVGCVYGLLAALL